MFVSNLPPEMYWGAIGLAVIGALLLLRRSVTFRLGVKSLVVHPLRSALTVLGIFIGVASVIWLLAIGEGISQEAQRQIRGLGATNIILRSIKPPAETLGAGRGPTPYGLTRDEFDRLKNTIPSIRRALPIREIRRQFRYSDRFIDGRLVGCTPEYADVMQLQVDRGHFLTPAEVANNLNVCVLASDTAERLFPLENPLGRSIHVEDEYYVIVGVTKKRMPQAGIGGSLAAQDFNADVYIPITTLWKRIGDSVATRSSGSFEAEIVELNQITLQLTDVESVLPTAELVKTTIAKTHKNEDTSLTVPLELLEQAETTRMMFMLFMGLIAAISLIVGGIGIMNIMLATVTERTREIGIRRALGAKRRDITRQFLAETIALSVVGGLTGILGGLLCPLITSQLRAALIQLFPQVVADLPPTIKTVDPVIVGWSIPLAFSISVIVGVVFGLYPARRAASMDPIEALRHD